MDEYKVVSIGCGGTATGVILPRIRKDRLTGPFTFIARDSASRFGTKGEYRLLHFLPPVTEPTTTVMSGYKTINLQYSLEEAIDSISEADIVFTAVGWNGIHEIGDLFNKAVERKQDKKEPQLIIMVENHLNAVNVLRNQINGGNYVIAQGLTGLYVPTLEKNTNHITVRTFGFEDIYIGNDDLGPDLDQFKRIEHVSDRLRIIDNFNVYSTFKSFVQVGPLTGSNWRTYYSGKNKVHEVFLNEDSKKMLFGCIEEGIIALKYKFANLDTTFTKDSFLKDYNDINTAILAMPEMNDDVTRAGQKPITKLWKEERVVAPALACLEAGVEPIHFSQAIAYGLKFDYEKDDEAARLKNMIKEKGIDYTISKVCQLSPSISKEKKLIDLIKSSYREIDHSTKNEKGGL
ncbi:MAG: hypothetical protein Q8R47_03880 [Nanoarchaeota archaeon]|nr:hypothetical protein [Nanoarchaeota archaeon]